MSKRRVVITGLGTINPLANNVPDTWESLINGESGIDTITAFDTSELPVSFAGEVKNFDANEYMGKQQARKLDKSSQLSIFATEEALKDANLNTDERLGPNVGIVFGTGIGGIGSTEQAVRTFDERGASRINPLAITQLMPNSSTGQVAIKYGIEGPSLTVTTACAASANAVGEAKNMIQNGIVDMVITGGTESGTTAMTIGAFAQIRALSTNNENPTEACKPFDKDRDGFVMGEGSTVLVMESEESAINRGAEIYGYVAGYGATSKSATVLNYCNIGSDLIEFISDTTPVKQGKYSPGAHIPVRSYEEFKNNYPDKTLLFAWNHKGEIMEKETIFNEKGGQWIVYVPQVDVI